MEVKPDLVIRTEFEDVTKSNTLMRLSKAFYAKDLPWKLVSRALLKEDGKKELRLTLFCNAVSESPGWSCDASIDTVLINADPEKNRVEKLDHKFHHDGVGRVSNQIIDCEGWTEPEKGFLKGDRCIIETRIFVKKTTNVRKLNLVDYTKPADNQKNAILVVEGKRLYVSWDLLAVNSPLFAARLGRCAEMGKKEMVLKDMDYDEFVDVLNAIYPTMIEINFSTVKHILMHAFHYKLEYALYRAELYLIKTTKIAVLEKLVLADTYRLPVLTAHCLGHYTDMDSLTALKPTNEYDGFSNVTKAAICDRIMDLCTTKSQQ
ncbi:hypothetical protein PFISCL1PPCAC_22319 [Pristionchus fissidentatus]|uniref:BTB domain-containing protein n=1 Tax=Pristionchus fissidentatus TaxID=1538716 RepID=A0AAV5WJ39_9BILA|nr:hypothetical protein PFISCL1PPCAC_22319 [Pristionchus fissidentatus]